MHASSPPARQPLIPDTHGDCARAGHPEAGAERNSCQGGLCGPGAPFASRLPNDKLTSQNPADWKSLGWFGKPGAIIGSDFAGTVAAIGPEAKVKWSIGDRVAGCNMGNFLPGRGAFAEYTRSRSDRLIAVPNALPLEQSATLGIPFYTAAQASRAPRSLANPQSRILLLTNRRSCSRPEPTSPLSRSLELHG